MSSIDKPIVTILEGDIESIDYGNPELNKFFDSLTPELKKKILQIKKKETQIIILKKQLEKKTKEVKEVNPSILVDVPTKPIEINPPLPEETEKVLSIVPNEILQ